MEENPEEIVSSVQDSSSALSEATKMEDTAKTYRELADKLDRVWKDCKIAHLCGTIPSIVGGILTIVATLTAKYPTRLLMLLGMALGAAGAATNVGTNMVEASIISTEIKKAEDYLKKVRKTALKMVEKKDKTKLFTTVCLALSDLELPEPIKKLFQNLALSSSDIPDDVLELAYESATAVGEHGAEIASDASRSAAYEGATAVVEHGAEIASDASGSAVKTGVQFSKAILFFNVFFLLLDVIHLGFTIRDIVKDEGSDVAENLRQEANKLERACRKLKVSD